MLINRTDTEKGGERLEHPVWESGLPSGGSDKGEHRSDLLVKASVYDFEQLRFGPGEQDFAFNFRTPDQIPSLDIN